MTKFGRRELLGFGFCTLATGTVLAEGTQRLPPTTVRQRPYVQDPTRSSSSGAAGRPGFPSASTPEVSADPTHNAPGAVDQTRLLLDSALRNFETFRKKSIADLRVMIELLASADEMKGLDAKLADARADHYVLCKSLLTGLIKTRLVKIKPPEPRLEQ